MRLCRSGREGVLKLVGVSNKDQFYFLLIMDTLLSMLETSKVGLSVNGCYAGGFVHADDIRTLSSSSDTLSSQVEMVGRFASEMHLKLNFSKCEVVTVRETEGSGDV